MSSPSPDYILAIYKAQDLSKKVDAAMAPEGNENVDTNQRSQDLPKKVNQDAAAMAHEGIQFRKSP